MSKKDPLLSLAEAFAARKVFLVAVDLQERYATPFLEPVYNEAQTLADEIEGDVHRRIWIRHNARQKGGALRTRTKPQDHIRDKIGTIESYAWVLGPERNACRGHFAIVCGVYAGACVKGVVQHSLLPYGFKPYVCLDAIDIRREFDESKPKTTEELRRTAQAIYGRRVSVVTRAEIMQARNTAFAKLAA